nr:MAG TPA: hypothetical protein [Caudoviricetes sp.]
MCAYDYVGDTMGIVLFLAIITILGQIINDW